ncbi:MAG: divergent PAP2 family protein [Clostridia bacterium]|nr:divergent PAP2 family protein [Clostridia bacterium]
MRELLTNKWMWIPLATWLLVQIFKLIVEVFTAKGKKINFRRILGAGGMPSSHTACITALATSIGISEGFGSPVFALAVVFCFIVMYDAAGVRRAAGKQAAVLNKIIESDEDINVQEKLVELLGHTPLQVIVGAIVGIIIGFTFSMIWDL